MYLNLWSGLCSQNSQSDKSNSLHSGLCPGNKGVGGEAVVSIRYVVINQACSFLWLANPETNKNLGSRFLRFAWLKSPAVRNTHRLHENSAIVVWYCSVISLWWNRYYCEKIINSKSGERNCPVMAEEEHKALLTYMHTPPHLTSSDSAVQSEWQTNRPSGSIAS